MVCSWAPGDATGLGAGRGGGDGGGAAERPWSEALCLARAVAALAMTHSEGAGGGVGSSPTSRLCSNHGGVAWARCGATRSHRRGGGGSRPRSGRALVAAHAEHGGGAIAKAVGRFRSARRCAWAMSDVSATSRRTRSRCRCQSTSSTSRVLHQSKSFPSTGLRSSLWWDLTLIPWDGILISRHCLWR